MDELAKASKLSKSYIWELENREASRPSVEKLEALAAALEVEPAFFLDDAVDDVSTELKDKQFFRNYSKLDDKDKDVLRDMLSALRKRNS